MKTIDRQGIETSSASTCDLIPAHSVHRFVATRTCCNIDGLNGYNISESAEVHGGDCPWIRAKPCQDTPFPGQSEVVAEPIRTSVEFDVQDKTKRVLSP